jgi:hypothetical protein
MAELVDRQFSAAVKPQLQRALEAIAATLELHRGLRRLELIFDGGRLVE